MMLEPHPSLPDSYMQFAHRGYGMDQRWYEWSMLHQREPVRWPAGARVAVWVNVALEFFPLDQPAQPFKAPGGMVTPYPDLETDLTSLKLWTQYHYRKDISLKLSYWYEDYSADNWALDNLQENSVGNLLKDRELTSTIHEKGRRAGESDAQSRS